EDFKETRKTAGLKISLGLGMIALGLIGLIVYQLFRIPGSESEDHAEQTRSAVSGPSDSPLHRSVKVDLNFRQSSSDLPPTKLSEGNDGTAGGNQVGREENQAAVEQFQAGKYEAAVALLGKAHDMDPM